MNEDGKLFLKVRFLAAVGGLFGRAMGGSILIVLLMVFTGSALGLTKIRQAGGMQICEVFRSVLAYPLLQGTCYPRR